MANELTTHGEQQDTLAEMFQGIMELVKDPNVSPEKAAQLLDLQERMMDRQQQAEFNKAMMAAMQEMPFIEKDGSIKNKAGKVQSKFARFETIDPIVRKIASSHGLSYNFPCDEGEHKSTKVYCRIFHTGGHVETYGPMTVPLDASGAKNPTQGVGSSLSYGKRYVLCAAFNIVTVDEDNDGNGDARGSESAALIGMEWTEDVLGEGHAASARGMAAYEAFYKGLSPMRKGWLLEEGHHADFKAAAERADAV